MSEQKNFEETREEILRVFGDKCPDLNNVLDKTTGGDKTLKAACIVVISKFKEKDITPLIVALVKASKRMFDQAGVKYIQMVFNKEIKVGL